ncbi:MAG: sensor histidine kinase [Gammaproteobacteria bacterium]|nr:MAG: sensor histidine kinase [Gammaproteobacteria bacterium]
MNDVREQIDLSMALRPKARILKTLGDELISSETVALIELVKNAYDADANNVLIKFSGPLVKGDGSLIVYDDGHGMDMATIRDSWMVIAASTKKDQKESKSGKRRVLGEKGIGRFASSKIATELELITKTEKNFKEIYALFDWGQFEDDELFLDEVIFLAEERENEEIRKMHEVAPFSEIKIDRGTILKMNFLKKNWENFDLYELQRGLSRLISPFGSDKEFNIYLDLPKEYSDFSAKIESPEIIKYPHYTVHGRVSKDGVFELSVKIEIEAEPHFINGNLYRKFEKNDWKIVSSAHSPEALESNKNLFKGIECGAFTFELRIWDRDNLENVIQKIGGGIRSIRKDLDAIAGINIYRDGFRVMPYGEPGNDWLRLDLRRVQNPTKSLSNNQITGYISITANENAQLHDRSNREGLDNNQAYNDLQGILKLFLNEVENLRWGARRKKVSGENESTDGKSLFHSPDFDAVKKSMREGNAEDIETIKLLDQVETDWKEQVKKFKTVLSQYHALATLGGIIDKVLHDGRQPLATIQTEAGLGKECTTEWLRLEGEKIIIEKKEIEVLDNGLNQVAVQANILRDVFRRVEPFGGRKKGRPKKYYIEEIIRQNFLNYQREMDENNIEFFIPETQTLVSIDITELSEIFTNLITNSIYWLNQVPRDKRYIRVLLDRTGGGGLEIIFSDSGPGVDPKLKLHIFEPYFSNKPDGHGLGLCLVGEIVKDYYNGTVELLDSGEGEGAVFRIVINERV